MRLKKMACAFLPKWRNPLTLRERLTKSTIWAGSVVLGLTVIFVVDIDCLSFGILSCKAGFNGHGWFILGLVSQGGVCSNPFMRTQFCWVVLWYSENQAWPYVSYSSPCYGMLPVFMGEILRPHSPSLASECLSWLPALNYDFWNICDGKKELRVGTDLSASRTKRNEEFVQL